VGGGAAAAVYLPTGYLVINQMLGRRGHSGREHLEAAHR